MFETNPSTLFDEIQLGTFQEMHPSPAAFAKGEQTEGSEPIAWYAGGPASRPSIDEIQISGAINRTRLIAMQADPQICTLELCVAILAWGGMNRGNRDHLFRQPVAAWIEVASAIRAGELSRSEAFDAFARLYHQKAIKGMRPAYFTKLIYFLMPRGGTPIGYIMDQWLGCSVNLLCGQEIVKMDHKLDWGQKRGSDKPERSLTSHVSAWNTGRDYQHFCNAIEALALIMGPNWTPETTELTLMSHGGHQPGAWRAHVKNERLARF